MDRIEQAIQQIQRGLGDPDSPERHRLFRQLQSELELHAAVEDVHVYHVFQQAEPTSGEVHDALEAHRQIKILLDELEAAPAFDHRWVSKFEELQKAVETHVAAEEKGIFRQSPAVMTAQEAEGTLCGCRNGETCH